MVATEVLVGTHAVANLIREGKTHQMYSALQAGKHVYVEKPSSHTVVEGRRMVQATARYKKIDLIGRILQAQSEAAGYKYGEGVLDIIEDGFGFLRSSDEYKVMALASYAEPKHLDLLREHVRATEDGGFHITPLDWATLAKRRGPDDEVTREHAELAASVQVRVEEVLLPHDYVSRHLSAPGTAAFTDRDLSPGRVRYALTAGVPGSGGTNWSPPSTTTWVRIVARRLGGRRWPSSWRPTPSRCRPRSSIARLSCG